MPRPRFSKLPPGRQAEILERAAEEFGAHGYARASLNRIIADLDLNKGSFYYYFDGKADLFEAVVQMIWDLAAPPADFDLAALDGVSFWSRIEEVFHQGHMRLAQKPWLAGVARLLLVTPGAEAGSPPPTDILERGLAWVRALLGHGQRLGVVRDDVPLDYLLAVLTGADHASDRWLLAQLPNLTIEEQEASSRRTVDLWRRISEPRPLPEAGSRPESLS